MPPKARFTRDTIVAAAVELVRERGHDSLNARLLAKALGCSTQPLLYQFNSIAEIRQETYKAANEAHTNYLMRGLDQAEDPLMELGLNYVRFAHEEPRLFRFLFQTNGLGARELSTLVDDPELGEMVALVSEASGISENEARAVFLSLFITAHGCASLLANNAIDYDERLVSTVLTGAYCGVIAQLRG